MQIALEMEWEMKYQVIRHPRPPSASAKFASCPSIWLNSDSIGEGVVARAWPHARFLEFFGILQLAERNSASAWLVVWSIWLLVGHLVGHLFSAARVTLVGHLVGHLLSGPCVTLVGQSRFVTMYGHWLVIPGIP